MNCISNSAQNALKFIILRAKERILELCFSRAEFSPLTRITRVVPGNNIQYNTINNSSAKPYTAVVCQIHIIHCAISGSGVTVSSGPQ